MPKEKSIRVKVFYLVLFLLMIYIFISGITYSYYNFKVIFTPNKLPEYRDDLLIEMNQEDLDYLKIRYRTAEREYFFCLVGEKKDNIYYVNSLKEIEISEASEFREDIIYAKIEEDNTCQEDKYIGSLHNHPKFSFLKRFFNRFRTSYFSEQDIYTFGTLRKPLHIVQFDEDKFNAREFTTDELLNTNPIRIEVK